MYNVIMASPYMALAAVPLMVIVLAAIGMVFSIFGRIEDRKYPITYGHGAKSQLRLRVEITGLIIAFIAVFAVMAFCLAVIWAGNAAWIFGSPCSPITSMVAGTVIATLCVTAVWCEISL